MRLIDADAFKELLGTDTKIRETFCKVIDAQPTAYDVEAVVAELENTSNLIQSEEGCGRLNFTEEAIDIVRNGGVK